MNRLDWDADSGESGRELENLSRDTGFPCSEVGPSYETFLSRNGIKQSSKLRADASC